MSRLVNNVCSGVGNRHSASASQAAKPAASTVDRLRQAISRDPGCGWPCRWRAIPIPSQRHREPGYSEICSPVWSVFHLTNYNAALAALYEDAARGVTDRELGGSSFHAAPDFPEDISRKIPPTNGGDFNL